VDYLGALGPAVHLSFDVAHVEGRVRGAAGDQARAGVITPMRRLRGNQQGSASDSRLKLCRRARCWSLDREGRAG
jgi:hypothetical protein